MPARHNNLSLKHYVKRNPAGLWSVNDHFLKLFLGTRLRSNPFRMTNEGVLQIQAQDRRERRHLLTGSHDPFTGSGGSPLSPTHNLDTTLPNAEVESLLDFSGLLFQPGKLRFFSGIFLRRNRPWKLCSFPTPLSLSLSKATLHRPPQAPTIPAGYAPTAKPAPSPLR